MKDFLNINELSLAGFGLTGIIILDESIWKGFGFKGVPKRGKYFDFLVSNQKLKLERFLIKELFSLCILIIADSLKTVEKYKIDRCDYRFLFLSGAIAQGIVGGYFKDLDELTETINEVNLYAGNSRSMDIVQNFIRRLFENVEVPEKNKAVLLDGAINLFGSSDRDFGLVSVKSFYIKLFNKYTPYGKLKVNLRENDIKKLINLSIFLIEEEEKDIVI